jgi:hypothetical protein
MPNNLPTPVTEPRLPSIRERTALWYRELPWLLTRGVDGLFAASVIIPPLYAISVISSVTVVVAWAGAFAGYAFLQRFILGGEVETARGNSARIANSLDEFLRAVAGDEALRAKLPDRIAHIINTEIRTLLTTVKRHDRLFIGIFEPAADEQKLHQIGRAGSTGALHAIAIDRNLDRASWLAYEKGEPYTIEDTTGNKAYQEREGIKSTVAIPILHPETSKPIAIVVVGAHQPKVITKALASSQIVPHLQPYLKMISLVVIAERRTE